MVTREELEDDEEDEEEEEDPTTYLLAGTSLDFPNRRRGGSGSVANRRSATCRGVQVIRSFFLTRRWHWRPTTVDTVDVTTTRGRDYSRLRETVLTTAGTRLYKPAPSATTLIRGGRSESVDSLLGCRRRVRRDVASVLRSASFSGRGIHRVPPSAAGVLWWRRTRANPDGEAHFVRLPLIPPKPSDKTSVASSSSSSSSPVSSPPTKSSPTSAAVPYFFKALASLGRRRRKAKSPPKKILRAPVVHIYVKGPSGLPTLRIPARCHRRTVSYAFHTSTAALPPFLPPILASRRAWSVRLQRESAWSC